MFSQRTRWSLQPNRLTERLAMRRRMGRPILDLTESNPTRCRIALPTEETLEAWRAPENLVYEPSPKGLPAAREAVAAFYAEKGVNIHPERIVLTASTSEAYSFLFRLLTDPGDAILVPRPSYPLFEFLAALNDVQLSPYPLRYEPGWRIDIVALGQAITPRTRALIVVNPNNPTGSFIHENERAALIELCRRHQLALISDEVFAEYAFAPQPDSVSSLAGTRDVLTFVLGGISKLLGLPQMKLAWIIASGPEGMVSEALQRLEIIADTYLSVNTPVQRALPRWLKRRDQWTRPIFDRVRANWHYLVEHVRPPHACQCLEAEGGWYGVLRIPRTRSEEEWALDLLERDDVLVHPGYFFDFQTEAHLVVSLLPPPEIFREGIERVRRRCADSSRSEGARSV